MKKNAPFILLLIVLVSADQASKAWVARTVEIFSSVKVIPGLFSITRIHNNGAIFGMFANTGKPWLMPLLSAASLVALGFVVFYFIKTPASDKWMRFALALIMAGAFGNLIDRVARGYVIDFLDFYYKSHHFHTFNVADSCITIGAIMLASTLVFKRRSACSPSS